MSRPRRDPPAPAVGPLGVTADLALFGRRLLRALPGTTPYAAEIVRQAGIVATGSTLVILAIAFLAGGSCGLEATSLARSFGFTAVAGGFSGWCTLREVVPFVFGYVVAAKVGCGLVAELGAMRVAEEVDAIDAMGVRSLAFLCGTRFLGCLAVLPFAYVLAVGSAYVAAYAISIVRVGDVAPGSWRFFFFLFQDPVDLVFSLVKGLVIVVWVIASALYFGYGVRGGPEEVGRATARSMGVNLIGVTVISMAGTLIFWGANPRLPLG